MISIHEAESAVPTWDADKGGKRCWLEFHEDKSFDLGADPLRTRFQEIVARARSGRYYPLDAVSVSGRFSQENREISAGDFLIQSAPLFGRFGGPAVSSVAKVFVCEHTDNAFQFGYVTTNLHKARGMWVATFTWKHDALSLHVKSIAMPGSLLYWLGFPIARMLQLRARRRSIEEFRKIPA